MSELDTTQDAEIDELILRLMGCEIEDEQLVKVYKEDIMFVEAKEKLLEFKKKWQQEAVDKYDPITDSKMRLWMTEEQFKKKLTNYANQVIGPDDPLQLASDAEGHIRYIQQVERNKLRREQREQNKA